MPLSHAPGHAQCDFGEALAVIGGVEQKAHCFAIDLGVAARKVATRVARVAITCSSNPDRWAGLDGRQYYL